MLLNLIINNHQPDAIYESVDYRHAKTNIIYIPFPDRSFTEFYKSDNQLKQFYKTIIVPDKLSIANVPVRKLPDYVSKLKQEIKGIRVEKLVKPSLTTPVIVDLTPFAKTTWQLSNSRGMRKIMPEFFDKVKSIYEMLTISKNLKAEQTVVVFDFGNSYQILDAFLMYLRLNEFKLPDAIADKYIIFKTSDNYRLLTLSDPTEINKIVFRQLAKIAKQSDNDVADTGPQAPKVNDIKSDLIQKAIQNKYNKTISDNTELESITTLVKQYVSDNPDIDVNLSDLNEVASLITKAISSKVKIGEGKQSFDDILSTFHKQYMYKQTVNADEMYDKRVIGINGLKATKIQWLTDFSRTKVEFDENLDKNIEKMVESLDDPDFGMQVQGIIKEIHDDGRSRFHIYKIKIKPDKGRAYFVKLKVPALVHDTYFKIGGNLYAINNQLMQKPLIKKDPNTVQLKTNYSVTNYSIQSYVQNVANFKDLVDKFLNIVRVTKKLKTAEVMDEATEARLREYGLDVKSLSSLAYKKIEIK